MMRSNSRAYSSADMNAFFTCSSSTSAVSDARRCSSSTRTSSVGAAPAAAGVQIGPARDRRRRAPCADGLAADAVAVVVEQRTLGRQLAALLVVAAHAARGRRRTLPTPTSGRSCRCRPLRRANAAMKYSGKTVSKRCATESVAEITIRRGPASRSMKGELADAVFTITRRPGRPRSSRRPLRDFQIRADQVELRVARRRTCRDRSGTDEQEVVRLAAAIARSRERAPEFTAVAAVASSAVSPSVVTCAARTSSRSIKRLRQRLGPAGCTAARKPRRRSRRRR